ncbi:hypothetical protein EJ357_41525 [Streptomyces cyaneochromogenes]|uniref:Uncharacterized protein n=1 Tax=Streptomyces cyaneochromogenes TaxID=2496836 RepID=A0A3Q9EZA6_9ACTN|nr:hypothetical protein [Streptomyces cyaneochromogenes]AZQ39120.1 hypothetical protein EJ357_41525 [Streptomyces cyaneochromogenes]
MELQVVLAILGAASVVSAFMYALKGLLDQIPDLIRSWRRVLDELRRAHSASSPDERGSSSASRDDL